ncbi:MAG: tetratricopeptide repeat protein [Actinobacteria bacterium]|nr:tetratricopeptide repeat protein [Actinomycetota bacterium]
MPPEDSAELLPTGTVTFMMTDVQGSTQLWNEHPEGMREAMTRHHQIIHEAIETNNGGRPRDQGEGDSILGAFARATDAVTCAIQVQRALADEPWPEGTPISVRAALHTDEAELRQDGNYLGLALSHCARLRAIAHGGQTLVSQATRELVGDRLPDGSYLKSLGPHRLKDLAVPQDVYQLCHSALLDDFPPLLSLELFPNNLPIQLTSFVGREMELREVAKLLKANRLVTLTGSGGSGKTRLALQAAADVLEDHSDGVWFIDLAAISDPELVPSGIASELGLKAEGGSAVESTLAASSAARPENLVQRLKDYIHWRDMLLLVDNCEHLISDVAEILESLLRACPNLRVLTTTREPLGISGEATYRVPSLSVPNPKNTLSTEELSEFEAVRLFLDRAALVKNDFEIDAQNGPAVAQICRRLDGIPLAIELAAARVKALSPEQIAARLDDQFRLLTGGSRTSLERQQTLRAAVDWSYRLLSESERTLLRRLSAFAGEFSLDAAEKVCADASLSEHDVLDLVAQLLDKSLVMMQAEVGEPRYSQLETIRQYAREKLLESGEGEATRERHRDFYLELAERAHTELEGREVARWLEVLDQEKDNLRAALEWSLADDNPERGLRIAGALGSYWDIRGGHREGLVWLEQFLSKPGKADPAVRAKALREAGSFTGPRDINSAVRLTEEALELSKQVGDLSGLSRGKLNRSIGLFFEGEVEAAISTLEEAVSLARQANDQFAEGHSFFWLGNIAHMRGDHAKSKEYFEEAMKVARAVGTPLGIARSLYALAREAHWDGDFTQEKVLLEESLALARETGDTAAIFQLLSSLTWIAEASGDDSLGAVLWEEASQIVRESGDVFWLNHLASEANRRGAYDEALTLFLECLSRYRELGATDGIALELNNAGWLAFLQGDLERSRSLLEEAISIHRNNPRRKVHLASSTHSLGEVLRVSGDLDGARALLEQSLTLSTELGIKFQRVAALLSLAEVARHENDLEAAKRLVKEAVEEVQGSQEIRWRADALYGCGLVAAAEGDRLRAARLLGAAEAQRISLNQKIPPVYVSTYQREVDALRSALDPEQFEKAWADGRAMAADRATEYALTSAAEPLRKDSR